MLRNGENLDSMRFSGIEKVHRNSIKITVDLWQGASVEIRTLGGGGLEVSVGDLLAAADIVEYYDLIVVQV